MGGDRTNQPTVKSELTEEKYLFSTIGRPLARRFNAPRARLGSEKKRSKTDESAQRDKLCVEHPRRNMTGSMRVEFSLVTALTTIVIASAMPRVHAASHVTMSLRYNSGCAVKSDGDAVCWGAGADGALGTGSTSNIGGTSQPAASLSIDLGTGRTAKMIDVSKHACAILDDDSLKCWGYNAAGQLGQNSLASIGNAAGEMGDNLAAVNLGTGKTAKSVAVGGGHTCVILNDDTVKCFGYNLYGQLGYGDTTDRLTPSASAVNLGTGRNARSICAGEHHSCAILDDASVKCWGYNNGGQLGYGDVAARSDPSVLSGVRLGSGRTAKFIACGNEHTCAILDDDGIKCWGLGTGGRLGQDDATTSYGSQSVSDIENLSTVNLGAGRTAKVVAAGYEHTCAILDDDTLKCWGGNTHGQLGYDDTTQRGTSSSPMSSVVAVDLDDAGPVARTAKWITAGDYITCAVLDNDKIKCWGRGTYAALGQGNTDNYGTVASSGVGTIPSLQLRACPGPFCRRATRPLRQRMAGLAIVLSILRAAQRVSRLVTADTRYPVRARARLES